VRCKVAACFAAFVWAGATATVPVATKWGRSSPLWCFVRVQNQRPRETQPQCPLQGPFPEEVNGTVNGRVNRIFHALFTFPRQKGFESHSDLRPSTTTHTQVAEQKLARVHVIREPRKACLSRVQ